MTNTDTDTEYEGGSRRARTARQAHLGLDTTEWLPKREAARRYRAARKAGVEKQASKQQPRKDLGFDKVKGQ